MCHFYSVEMLQQILICSYYLLLPHWRIYMNLYLYLTKYFFIYITAFVLYFQLQRNLTKKSSFKAAILSVILTLIASMYTEKINELSVLFSYLLFCLTIMLFFHIKPKPCIISSLISFIICYSCFVISAFVCGLILLPRFSVHLYQAKLIYVLLSGILTLYISQLPFRFSKFKKRIKHLYNSHLTNFALTIGFLILFALSITQLFENPNNIIKLIPFYIIFVVFLLLFLWQHFIRQYYLTKLRHLELESLRQELAEKDAVIEKLQANNELQARMIHKDNKLIPAMLSAVTEYLSMVDSNDRTMQEHGTMLAGQLKELADERLTVLTAASEAAATLPLLHRASVDAMLSYMQKRAMQENILFEVKIHPDFEQKIEISITEPDLTHLLSDLLENAIIATKTAADRHIFVHLGILYDAAVVEVSDSGQAFEPSVYQDFGLQKHSTHLDNGGSGIGLMDIWELKKKYAASLHIYEYTGEAAPFTKKISIVFDRKKHYLIRTFRPEELVKMQARSDLYILPLNDGKD